MKNNHIPDDKTSSNRAIILGIISIFLWCWSGICFRRGSEEMGSAMVYLTFMSGGGTVTAVILQMLKGKPVSDLYHLPKRVMLAGFFGVALYTIMLAQAFGIAEVSDIGQINLLHYLWPVWMVILGIILLGDRPKMGLAFAGIFLGLFGVVISKGLDIFSHPPSNFLPHFLALAGGFLWALYLVLLRKWNIPEEKGGTAFHFFICAVLAGIAAYFLNEWGNVPSLTFSMVFWIVFGGVGPVGIAYSLYEISVKNGPVLLIASLAYFIPIGSSLLIGLFFKETSLKNSCACES
jgi:drug/metabolite transporter (DMT)-like permease